MTDLVAVERRPQSTGAGGSGALESQLETYRVELTAYSYRMLGSGFEAEDAVQEAMVRAWRGLDRFEGRSALRSWLYRITTNVCLDMLRSREKRARPMDLSSAQTAAGAVLGEPLAEAAWIQPVPDSHILPGRHDQSDPAEAAVLRESVQLAFVAALQLLPPRQRAVLILREVLQWSAAEVARLLDSTVASVNSALQRARATLAEHQQSVPGDSPAPGESAQTSLDEADRLLLQRYIEAFERYDIEALVMLLHEDATLSMPPYDLWIQGPVEIGRWLLGPGAGCLGSRLIPTSACGSAAFGQYRASGPGGSHEPWSLQVIETSGGRITAINAFLDTSLLFPLFSLPARLDPSAPGDESGAPDQSGKVKARPGLRARS